MRSRIHSFLGVVLALISLALSASAARAGGGNVMPANANPKGYSLAAAAAATAVYDTGAESGNPATPPPPQLPFQLVIDDITVKPGTMLYVPVFHADDSGVPDPAPFPASLNNPAVNADYLIDAVNAFIHDVVGLPDSVVIDSFVVFVDGKPTVLNPDYTVGVTTPPLLDGPPAGTHFIVSGVFLTPLTPGNHTVGIGGLIAGQPAEFAERNVTVK
jgi:hypothetical protein